MTNNAKEKLKKNSDRKRSILKGERTSERESKQNIEDTDDKDTDMERVAVGPIWLKNMDHEERPKEDIERLVT